MASGPWPPRVRWGRRTGHRRGTHRVLGETDDGTSPSARRKRTPPPHPHLSPGHRRRAVAGTGENWETYPSHSLPQPHPLPEGRSKVLEAAMAAPCPAAPTPTTLTTKGLGVSETSCAVPAAPAGRGRYPESLCWPRPRRTPHVRMDSATGRRRKNTDATWDVTSGLLGWAVGGASCRFRVVAGTGTLCFKSWCSEGFQLCRFTRNGAVGLVVVNTCYLVFPVL